MRAQRKSKTQESHKSAGAGVAGEIGLSSSSSSMMQSSSVPGTNASPWRRISSSAGEAGAKHPLERTRNALNADKASNVSRVSDDDAPTGTPCMAERLDLNASMAA